MIDLNIVNFLTIGVMSVAAWVAFQWTIAFMGWSMPGA